MAPVDASIVSNFFGSHKFTVRDFVLLAILCLGIATNAVKLAKEKIACVTITGYNTTCLTLGKKDNKCDPFLECSNVTEINNIVFSDFLFLHCIESMSNPLITFETFTIFSPLSIKFLDMVFFAIVCCHSHYCKSVKCCKYCTCFTIRNCVLALGSLFKMALSIVYVWFLFCEVDINTCDKICPLENEDKDFLCKYSLPLIFTNTVLIFKVLVILYTGVEFVNFIKLCVCCKQNESDTGERIDTGEHSGTYRLSDISSVPPGDRE